MSNRKMLGTWLGFIALATGAILAICVLVYLTSQLAPLDWLGFCGLFWFICTIVSLRHVERFGAFCKELAMHCKELAMRRLRRQDLKEERR